MPLQATIRQITQRMLTVASQQEAKSQVNSPALPLHLTKIHEFLNEFNVTRSVFLSDVADLALHREIAQS